jgi:hypothetical protein
MDIQALVGRGDLIGRCHAEYLLCATRRPGPRENPLRGAECKNAMAISGESGFVFTFNAEGLAVGSKQSAAAKWRPFLSSKR